MALTAFQRSICRLLAPARKARESDVAGGAALNTALLAPRRSRDVDLFHDSEEALASTVAADRLMLAEAGCQVRFLREAPAFAEALVSRGGESTIMQWTRDSAFRFFPLVEDEDFGLVLHPFDLATNKVLAMAGRLEPRDWIDVLNCHDRLQKLGYLVWAACGKDPGYGAAALLQEMQRSSRYTQAELDLLDFASPAPDAAALGRRWHSLWREAGTICDHLPPERVGTCVLTADGNLCNLPADALPELSTNLHYHQGRLGGAWPRFPQR